MNPSAPAGRGSGAKTAAAVLALFAATLAAYRPALGGAFLWNDSDYVTAPALRPVRGLGRIWLEPGATQQYTPVLHTAFWLEHRLWGDDPAGYHWAGVLLHAAAAVLFGLVLRRLFRSAGRPAGAAGAAWLAAAVFALHPVCAESVAWITEQKNTLSTAFALLSALAWLSFDERRGRAAYLAALALYLLALLSKATTVVLPAGLLAAAWWRRGRLEWRRDLRPLLPWFALGAAMGFVASWVERAYVGARGPDFALGPAQRVLVAGRAVWFYLGKLLWPRELIFIYPKWSPDPSAAGQWVFPAALVALFAALWLLRGRGRAPLAALAFFVASLLPVLGFIPFYGSLYSFVADHWQYLPSLGPIALGAAALAAGIARLPAGARPAAWATAFALPALLGAATRAQCRIYRDNPVLYRSIVARNASCWMAYTNLGNELMASGRMAEAVEDFEQALRTRDSSTTRNSLGAALAGLGRFDEAEGAFSEALKLEPEYAEARVNLAGVLAREGRPAEAEEQYRRALRSDPGYAPAHNNLGTLLFQSGRAAEAADHYERALRIAPAYADAHLNLGNVLLTAGDVGAALEHYREALRLKPNLAEAHYDLGVALRRAGRDGEADAEFARAASLEAAR